MQQPQVLPSFLIPIQEGQVVLPRSIVVESLPFATPLKIERAPPWIVGAILWRARTTPLVNLDALIKGSLPDAETHSRIVVLNALSDDPKLRNYCILATGVSRPIELERASVSVAGDDDEILRPPGISRRTRISGEPAIIPDLDFIEEILRDVVLKKHQSSFRTGAEARATALA